MKLIDRLLSLVAIVGWSGAAVGADLPVPCGGGICGAGLPDVFVTSGEATYSTSGSVGTIEQLSDRAILNWQQFNIANGSRVIFRQPRDISVALNRIHDQSPSQILGAVTANGQIYLINPNGMIFGENARVNVNTLIASSLDIPDSVFNGPGLAGAINQGGGVAALSAASGPRGDIDVARGAVLETADGGRIFIFAPRVVNEGSIVTPGGQTILAASKDKIYLEFSTDPAVRGFLVEVATGGEAVNLGEIIAERGNVTMAGILVRQQGVVSATTSVRENGSIRLLARDNVATIADPSGNRPVARSAGELEIGEGSITRVSPDKKSNQTAVDAQVQQPSSIELMGKKIHIGAGAQLIATGGRIDVTATTRPDSPLRRNTPQNDASLIVDAGARIDASGDRSTVVAMSRNQVDLDLRSNELADSPLQRGGVLQGETVSVDVRTGTRVANVDKAVANIKRGINERLSSGGIVTLGSEGSMQLAKESVIDFSGGSVTYESGSVSTSKLISNGKVVDISDADPNATYSEVFSGTTVRHADWGVTENFVDPTGLANAQWEEGYVEGKDAGSLSIIAHSLTLDGSIKADTISGLHQHQPTAILSGDATNRPYQQLAQRGAVSLLLDPDVNSIVDVTLGNQSRFSGGVLIRPDWISQSRLGSFNLKTYGQFVYGNETQLKLPGDTSFDVTAGSIAMDGSFVSPSGKFTATSRGATAGNAPITIGSSALVNVAGWWINDSPALGPATLLPRWIDGGSIVFSAGGDFEMRQGSMLDVSGGAWLNGDGLADGKGGSISLGSRAGIDTRFLPQSGLRGFALHEGGTLRFDANSLVLYDAPSDKFIPAREGASTPEGPIANPFPLDFLSKIDTTIPSFFLQQSGFENFEFVSNRYGTVVAPGANLLPLQKNYLLSDQDLTRASGTYLADFASIVLLPVEQRRAANLTLAFERDLGATPSGSVVIMPGARIQTDIGGAINLRSEGSLMVQGLLATPAGRIRLSLDAPRVSAFPYIKNQVLWVDNGAALLAPGAFRPAFDALGRTIGDVLPGGAITLDAAQGFVVTRPGAVFDVGGTARELDIVRTSADLVEPTWIASDSGSVFIRFAEGGLINGKFNAQNSRALSRAEVRGGTFNVTFDPNRRRIPSGEDELNGPDLFPDVERNLVVTDVLSTVPFQFGDVVSPSLLGHAEVSIGNLAKGGFDSVTLSAYELFGVVGRNRGADARLTFGSSVDATFGRYIGLNAPLIEAAPGALVSLHAPFAQVGYDFIGPPTNRVPVSGTAQFSMGTSTLELQGNVIFSGFGRTSFDVDGDVRLLGVQPDIVVRRYAGSLQVAGNLNINANRIYPTTLTHYSIRLLGNLNTTVSFGRRGNGDSPLFSVAGSLDVSAPNIDVEGRLFAPQGQIALNATDNLHVADGGVVSVALQDDVTLFGRTQAGIDWVYPFPEQRLQIIDRLLAKAIALDGASVELDSGSKIDLSGGGRVMAYEFTPGPGGSVDVLDAANTGKSFVILPTKALPIAPYEPLESASFAYAKDAGVQLGAIAGLEAGEYAVLPARFALLPGAMLVTPIAGTLDMIPGEVRYDVDGAPIVAGRFTVMGNSTGDSRYLGFKVQPGSFAETQSGYLKTDANKFFVDREGANGLLSSSPDDAGDVSVSGIGRLTLDGSINALGSNKGRAGRLDVIADRIAIVAQRDAAVTGYVNIAAADINGAQVGSITLGAKGIRTATGLDLDVRASSVLVSSGVELVRPELVLAATGDVTVADGARVAATGSSTQAAENIDLESGAASLVVSSRDVDVVRKGRGGAGKVVLQSGSSIEASGTLAISVATDAVLDGQLSATGAAFAVDAQHLALGDGAPAAAETRLSGAMLGSLSADKLQLSSRDSIAIHGVVDITAREIALRGPGIDHASDDASLSVTAGRLSIDNSGDSVPGGAPATATGGSVSIQADEIEVANGTFQVRGFAQVNATAGNAIVGSGRARLTSTGDIMLAVPEVTTRDGSSIEVDSAGVVEVVGAPNSSLPPRTSAGIGGTVRLSGQRVVLDTSIAAHSGSIELVADGGDVELRDGGRLDVSGVTRTLGSRVIESDGGRISLSSQGGDITTSAGSELNVAAGGASSSAGSIDVIGASGRVTVASALVGGAAADFSVDAGSLVDVEALNTRIESAGFADTRSYRQRQGNLIFGAGTTISVHRLELAADAGAISFDGVANLVGADASGLMSAATRVAIGGQITATKGGNVTINALSEGATIEFASTARVNLEGGVLRLRMRDNSTVAQRILLPAAGVGATTNLDLVTSYFVDDGVFDAVDQESLRALLVSSDANLGVLRSILPSATSLSLSSLITSSDDLSVVDAMDLIDWRFGDRPGTFGFHSGRDLNLRANISDGFAAQTFQFQGEDIPVLRPTAGPSHSYAFVAGADLGSANPLTTHDGVGNVTLGEGTRIRTGSGDIAIRAGSSLLFASDSSSLYTAGESTGTGGFDDVFSYAILHDAQYPTNGGAVDVVVGRNIVGAKTRQLMSQYMARFGGRFFDQSIPTMVGIVFDYNFGPDPFGQNIGSFGGGAVRIKAGGDVTDLSVIVPETLQHAGNIDASFDPFQIAFTDNSFTRRGRTTLDVESGGDIVGGLYYLGSGVAKISATGRIAQPSSGPGLLLATGDASFTVAARGDVWIESMFNPTMLPQDPLLQLSAETSYFFSYADASRLDVMSLAGRVTFSNDVEKIRNSFDFSNETRADRPLDIYPSHVTAVALTDSIEIRNGMTLYPGAGGFELLASQDIIGPLDNLATLYLPDTDPEQLPNVNAPATDLVGTELRLPRSGRGDAALIHATVPVHRGDTSPSQLVAQRGSINAPLLAIVSSEALRIQSNADIDIGRIEAQNVNAADVTSVVSGGDITIKSQRNPDTGQVITNSKVIRVGGGGELQVVAGRSVDLGSSEGLQTSGNLDNPALASGGAGITVVTGAAVDPQYDTFIDLYLVQSRKYDAVLVKFIEARTGVKVADSAEAIALLRAQPGPVQQEFVLGLFFTEIRASGITAAELIAQKAPAAEVEAAYAPGRLAISTLFPKKANHVGDLRLFFSQIATLDGGSIKLVVPGGIVNAGLATTSISSKQSSDLGIVAQRVGDIDVYASGDVQVNQSRVFTLSGGDINMWSNLGNIDAGRGAKTALAAPGLSVVLGENDSVEKIVPPDISGSGIAAAAGAAGELPDIVLSTPNGIVDAGDAGIRTPGRLFTAATEFLGRDNVDVGSFVGAPVGAVSLSADLAGVGNSAASASQSIAQAAVEDSGAASNMSQSKSQIALGWLEVFLEGYGDSDSPCDADRDPSCRAKGQ